MILQGSNDPYEGFAIRTTPVGYYDGTNQSGFQTRANANHYGIFDLCGNVSEIVNDYNNPVQGQYRTRGGSYIDGTSAVDVNDTDYINNGEDQYSGFRVMTTFP